MNIHDIANSHHLKLYLQKNINDPWAETPYFGYRHVDNAQKGAYGEIFTALLMHGYNFAVQPPVNRGHDRIIDGYKTEIKFSLAHSNKTKTKTIPNQFTMNHVSVEKDWDRLIFIGVNHPDTELKPVAFYFTKNDFLSFREDEKFFECFSYQQGGTGLQNDDYMSAGKKLLNLYESPISKELNRW